MEDVEELVVKKTGLYRCLIPSHRSGGVSSESTQSESGVWGKAKRGLKCSDAATNGRSGLC